MEKKLVNEMGTGVYIGAIYLPRGSKERRNGSL